MYRNLISGNAKCKEFSFIVPFTVQKRYKSKKLKGAALAKMKYPVDKALEHFDDFYKKVYGKRWPSIRLALLCPRKYCAVLNNYAETEVAASQLENIGAINLKNLYDLEKKNIKQNEQENERKKGLEEIFKLDKKMEEMLINTQEKELMSLYPQSVGDAMPPADILSDSTKQSDQHDVVMKETNEEAEDLEVDSQRVINPVSGLSAAALYEYVPATRLKGMEDWIGESQHYRYYKTETDFPVHVENDSDFLFPEYLQVYTFERGNISSFPPPRRDMTDLYNYYLMDGGSLLPVLALDLRPADKVLDMCAAPGGKSYIMLQTLFPGNLVCNEAVESRMKRIHSMFDQFLHNKEKWAKRLIFTNQDARCITDYNVYNKILVDVPCTTDRHSLHENDNNIFEPRRIKERLVIPELQTDILSHALKLVQPGGTVIYSTCTLSPIQNDGVVHMALQKIWQETDIQIVVKDMTTSLKPLQCAFKFAENLGLRYGHLVLPFLPCNFGPMYVCKLVRIK
ncbi:hypothetical protein L9F63_003889 [Diploptera punctata]|uniref:NOL1/NOP2/Sun domain family member 4 n=1 Tax=Diploptera punctata TaxID=6984 RepID=A0AAD7ZK60_DIPPU|nr:hypothetical protein L9F63_003889 [Diploptera punctata]